MLPHAPGVTPAPSFGTAAPTQVVVILGLLNMSVGGGLAEGGLIAGGVDCVHDLLVRDVGRNGDVGGLQGEIHGGFHAVELAELPFHAVHARRTRHALDVQFNNAAVRLVQ
jgi:hypothetical protein